MFSLAEFEKRFLAALSLLSLLALALFGFRIWLTDAPRYLFVPGNLALSWLVLGFAWLLAGELKVKSWLSWQNIALTVLWLLFLPNAWYVLTDFVHVYPTGEVSELYDIALMAALTATGFILGFTSLFLVHRQLIKRLARADAAVLVAAVIFASSFGIYLGRTLRWNTWDIATNPGGVILNVSDRLINPFADLSAFSVSCLFFVLLGGLYAAMWLVLTPSKRR